MERYDVAVIGAGPAGAAAAISLARQGRKVALIDKEKFPRDKLCGDFVNPINWPMLRELGVDGDALASRHEKVAGFLLSACSGETVETALPLGNEQTGFGLGLQRSLFDDLLVQKARRTGAVFFDGCRVGALERSSDGWSLAIAGSSAPAAIRASILVGADGRNSWLAHRLGLAGASLMQGRAVGFQFRIGVPASGNGKVEIHLVPGGYAGVVGLGDGTLNLCMAVDKKALPPERQAEFLWERCLPQNPRLRQRLARGELIGPPRSTYPVYFRARRSFADGVLLAGDAARVSEPVSGEGIYFAMKSGLLAAETVHAALARGDVLASYLSRYGRECRRAFRSRRAINALFRYLIYRPALLAPLIRLSARRRRPLDFLVQAICKEPSL